MEIIKRTTVAREIERIAGAQCYAQDFQIAYNSEARMTIRLHNPQDEEIDKDDVLINFTAAETRKLIMFCATLNTGINHPY